MTTKRKAKTANPTMRVVWAVHALDNALCELNGGDEVSDEQLEALTPYVEEEKVDSLISMLSTIQQGYPVLDWSCGRDAHTKTPRRKVSTKMAGTNLDATHTFMPSIHDHSRSESLNVSIE